MALSFKSWLNKFESINYNSKEVIVPKGTILYHGTVESFDNRKIEVGGYDKIFWTTENIMIARSYIPSKSSYSTISLERLARTTDKELDDIRKSIGLSDKVINTAWKKDQETHQNYLYWKNELDKCKDFYQKNKDNEEFIYSDKWDDFYKKWSEAEDNYKKSLQVKSPQDRIKSFIVYKMKSFGYDLVRGNFEKITFDDRGNLLPASHKSMGSVLKIICNRDFNFYNEAFQKEGDLMDLDYKKIDLFRNIEDKKDLYGKFLYDGIIINDFAQTDYYGDFGHVSIGFFKRSLKDLSIKKIRDQTHPGESEWKNQIKI
jgi:hypothetical protein